MVGGICMEIYFYYIIKFCGTLIHITCDPLLFVIVCLFFDIYRYKHRSAVKSQALGRNCKQFSFYFDNFPFIIFI